MERILGRKKLLTSSLLTAFGATFLLSGVALAAGTLTVSPTTGLKNGQTVTVSGSGLQPNSTGTITECNNDAGQPTIAVAGNPVPVSCYNPLKTLVTTDASGTLKPTSFTIHTGTVGPPAAGTDSSGGDAAADAAKYPCPPTSAQIAAGDSCNITFGDAAGDDLIQPIQFASATKPTPTKPTAPTTPKKSQPTPQKPAPQTSSNLVNTGPGDVILLFAAAVLAGAMLHRLYFKKPGSNAK